MSGKLRFVLDTNAVVSLLAGNRSSDRHCFADFCKRVDIVSLAHDDSMLMEQALDLRSRHRLKLPDAIIGATALSRNALLITNDSHFSGIAPISVQSC